MIDPEIQDPELIYADTEPDVNVLIDAYRRTIADVDYYLQQCNRASNDRDNWWPGKAYDLRKHGAAVMPWDGCSDQEVQLIEEKISTCVTNMLHALSRANIMAYPVEMQDLGRAQVVSAFLKWLISNQIKDFKKSMERGANHLLEKGLMVSYVGWQSEIRSTLQVQTMEQISQMSPELAEMIQEGDQDEELAALLQQMYPGITSQRSKKALRDLRKKGEAEIPLGINRINRPIVRSCTPDGDIFFPPYCTDPQRAPYMFYREFLTAQEILKRVTSEGWDRDWADYVTKNCRGLDIDKLDGEYTYRTSYPNQTLTDNGELVLVVWCYQRLIDEDDGSEGIYCTIYQPNYSGTSVAPSYAKHELVNGFDDYPVVVTKLSDAKKRIYDVKTFPDLLRGTQNEVKVQRDSRIDRTSLAVLPPMEHPAGRPPTSWGPGAKYGYRRRGEVGFAEIPRFDQGSGEIEMTMLTYADKLVGQDMALPNYAVRQQFFIDKFLSHVCDVIKASWKLYQKFGPDEQFFQVTGIPNGQMMTKGDPNEDYDIMIFFDAQSTDPETMEKRLAALMSLMQFDKTGKLDSDKLIEFAAYSIDPGFAATVVQPSDTAQAKMVEKVTSDLAKIYSGVEVGAQPNGAQVAMQVIDQWMQQPDVQQRMQSDEFFKKRVETYYGQYQMQIDQAQNAQIGKLGTAPAAFQGTNV